MTKQEELFEVAVLEKKGKSPSVKKQSPTSSALPDYFAPLQTLDFDGMTPLGRYASTQYLQYAIATVKDRALPRVADGQKPVQSRILYAMWEMNALSGTPRKKSARVVGDVLGKFHPHGDASVYDALVRIAQDFTLRYPLVDGEGNFGSRDGDDAAAMRYTEARLTQFAEVLLSELDEGTVDYVPNYDGSVKEPKLLPARLPVMLLNGASGIAVGMATEIPSHNLNEVAKAAIALIKNRDLSSKQLMRSIKGPDFPGGAQIITPQNELAEIYANGRGAIRVRARWEFEKLARGQWQLVVSELPPGVSARKVQEEIDGITNPIPRAGKKTLGASQQREKQGMLMMLDRMRDESDRTNPVRLVFEPKTSKIDQEEFANMLLAKTSLEINVPVNIVSVGLDGRPAGKNIQEVLLEWVDFRLNTVTKRTQFRLAKVQDRIHVLEGRLLVLLNVDRVIKVIRNSDQPRVDLIKEFKLTERQADDILDMRLRQLAKLEHIKVEQELKALQKSEKDLKGILKTKSQLEDLVISEIESDVKVFGDKRRTVIEESERAFVEVKVIDEPITVIFSKKGWVRARQGWDVNPDTLSFKEGDSLLSLIQCRTIDAVSFLDSKGRAYSVEPSQLPSGRGDGVPASSLVDLQGGGHILFCVAGPIDTNILVATSGGYGFVTKLSSLVSNRKAGRDFIAMNPGEIPVEPKVFEQDEKNVIVTLSKKGKLLTFSAKEIKELARGRGVILMGLDDQDELSAVGVTNKRSIRVCGRAPRSKKEESLLISGDKFEHHYLRRARMGRVLAKKLDAPFKLSTD